MTLDGDFALDVEESLVVGIDTVFDFDIVVGSLSPSTVDDNITFVDTASLDDEGGTETLGTD